MSPSEFDDRLVDVLLHEILGNDSPPDVRPAVMAAIQEQVLPSLGNIARPALRKPPRRRVRPSRFPAFAAAAALVLLSSVLALVLQRYVSQARTPILAKTSGQVSQSHGQLLPGTVLTTASDSVAFLSFPDGSSIEVGPDTTLIATRRHLFDGAKSLELVAGRVDAQVAPQPEGNPMRLSSAEANVEVVGTRFSLARDTSQTRLEVVEGAVLFASRSENRSTLVGGGRFAEAGADGFEEGVIQANPERGITGFTLMNALTDLPLRDSPLADGESVSLSSLATTEINIRVDYAGDPPVSMRISVSREDGGDTGLPGRMANPQKYPPFFAAGDHWADGRPNDCAAWTPAPGHYRIHVAATFSTEETSEPSSQAEIRIEFTH